MGFMTRRNMIQRAAKRAALCEKKEAPKKVVKAEVVEPVKPENPVKEEPKKDASITKEEVLSMPYFKVKSVAQANGIDVADKKTAELRAAVIESLGL